MALLGQVFHFSSLPLNRYSATCFNLFPESGLALPISPGLVPLTAPFTKPLPIAPRRKGPTAAAPPLNGPNPGRDDGARRRPFYLFFPPRASPAKKMPPRGQTLAGIDGKTDNGAIEPHAFKLLLASFCRGSSFPGLKGCSCVFNFSPHFRQTRSRRMTVSNARVAMTPVSAFRLNGHRIPPLLFLPKIQLLRSWLSLPSPFQVLYSLRPHRCPARFLLLEPSLRCAQLPYCLDARRLAS